ncbi:L-aspartate oxidase [Serinibacter salmoneus]|uniref:L-aspartate oxidase n=1 Tax=Serinibacter salmoneus TaxID=556530 RepID=A0A2A9CXT1_9MICO|nr:L-aspartate oxidase [Serinibacter salmoneus]PFG19213.1 L-aspartate oxidase [Serinibacter salmoneus]
MNLVVVGSGLAGLLTAIEASTSHHVTLVTKDALAVSNTAHAQGGIAVVGGRPDTVVSHVTDTRRAGAGLSDPAAAMTLAAEGPAAIDRLLELGVRFDREDGVLCRALEGAHSHPRVLRAGGDATGAEMIRALAIDVLTRAVEIREHTTAVDLVLDEQGACVALDVLPAGGDIERLPADAVVLATGGAGQLFPTTTNPQVATADGVGMALRAGAEVADAEMIQFHPTVLLHERPFLLSEALRGEGAVLLDSDGERFMPAVHPDAELAPRDVVARAIAAQADAQGSPVMLDATALAADLAERFPTIVAACRERGLDLAGSPVPVSPAAHYWMGGVRTDLAGRTSVPGLWAAGEVACTGVHGANRLASNSLLEAAVFARRLVAALAEPVGGEEAVWGAVGPLSPMGERTGWAATEAVDLDDARDALPWTRADLQEVMWSVAGLTRDADGLRAGARALAAMATPELVSDAMDPLDRRDVEDANLLIAARAVVAAALAREGSLGAHVRSDAGRDAGTPAPGSAAVHHVLRAERTCAPIARSGGAWAAGELVEA